MNEITRKLATIEQIIDIKPHPNADKLEIVFVRGWQIVIQKEQYNPNDLVVFFEIDSFLPIECKYEFLRKSSFKSTNNLGDGFRIKTIKLRGEISQGLIMPIFKFSQFDTIDIINGMDVTEILNIQKYEPQINFSVGGDIKGNFPNFIPKTDQERIQNLLSEDFEKYKNDTFEITTKLDGCSMTIYINEGNVGVCSRNFELSETKNNIFWDVFKKINIKYENFTTKNFALQGELVGPKVNGNKSQLKNNSFYIFNIYDIDERRYLFPKERILFFNNLILLGINIKHVPILHTNHKMVTLKEGLTLADHLFNGFPTEGIVFKSNENQFSFKVISNNYLLKKDE